MKRIVVYNRKSNRFVHVCFLFIWLIIEYMTMSKQLSKRCINYNCWTNTNAGRLKTIQGYKRNKRDYCSRRTHLVKKTLLPIS